MGLNQAELNGNRRGEAISCFSRQAGRLHAEEGRSATSAQLSGQGVWGNLLDIEFEAERKCGGSGEQRIRNYPEPKCIRTINIESGSCTETKIIFFHLKSKEK